MFIAAKESTIILFGFTVATTQAGFLIPKDFEKPPPYLDPRNPFTIDKPGSSSITTIDCNTIFSCPECLGTAGCGWCDTKDGAPSCQTTFDRDQACGGREDAWVGQEPAGQQCPNRLFRGTSTTNNHETSKLEGGFGTKNNGRYKISSKLYFGKFKKPLLKGGKVEYERPEIPEEITEMLKSQEFYTDGKARRLPKL